MERDKLIIIALIVIIAALLVCVATMIPNTTKQDTNLTFKSNATLTEGDSLKIMLTDVNGTAIVNQTVNVTITDENQTNDYQSVVTDEKGIGTFKLDKYPGEYNVTISYGGNDNYTGCNSTKKITIEEKPQQTVSESSSSSDSGGWTTVSPGGDGGSKIVTYHDGNGHMYVTRYSADGSAYEDGIAYDEGAPITS